MLEFEAQYYTFSIIRISCSCRSKSFTPGVCRSTLGNGFLLTVNNNNNNFILNEERGLDVIDKREDDEKEGHV